MKCCARLTMFEVIKKIILIVKSTYRSYYIYNREFQLFVYKYRYCNITTEIVRKRFDEVWYVNKMNFPSSYCSHNPAVKVVLLVEFQLLVELSL